jgi:hypothetical protein
MLDRSIVAASQRWTSDFGQLHVDLVGPNHDEVNFDLSVRWKEMHGMGLSVETPLKAHGKNEDRSGIAVRNDRTRSVRKS